MMIKKTLPRLFLFCLCGVLLWGFSSYGAQEEQRVFDEAGLFTTEEIEALETQIQSVGDKMKMDVAVLTIEDAMGKSSEAYADDFYDEQDLGRGSSDSGALFLIDMDNGLTHVSTYGEMKRYLTDDRIESVLDDSIGYASDGDFAACASSALSSISQYVEAGIVEGQYNYDRDTGKVSRYKKRSISLTEAIFALSISGFTAAFACRSVVSNYKMKAEQKQALNFHLAYRGASAFAFTSSNDLFLNKTVTQRRIPRSTSTGTKGSGGLGGAGGSAGRTTVHRSSSGRSHGGGGRRF